MKIVIYAIDISTRKILSLTLSTRGETVSYKRSSTGAGLPVIGGRTYGSRSARVFVGTKGDALLATTEGAGGGWIVTNLVGGTVLVSRRDETFFFLCHRCIGKVS